MAELVTSIAAKLIEVLGYEAINKVCELWGYKTQLEELKGTVSTVKAVLLDADAKWDHLSNQEKDFIRKLRDVVYDADDVFDEFFTLAQLNLLDGAPKKRDKILRKVRRFFSSKNQVGQAYRMSCQVKDIKKRLDAIASDRSKFNLGVDVKPISRRPKETCSYVNVTDIIGRDKDKEIIVNMLLAPNASENAPDILAIVGVGGLGKTALAQFVFNDEKIKQEFLNPTAFRLWVCVSDQDWVEFDDKGILCKILELVTSDKPDINSSMQIVITKFHENFGGKKFLLVLDDLWNEDRQKWVGLQGFLRVGGRGSKNIVTTRSEVTATNIGSKHVLRLDGLSTEYSQRLFEMSAFGEGHELGNHHELVKIGKKIVEKCYNIPLALKVVGSLLYGQDINKWRSIQESGLANINNGNNGVLSVLKLSYHNLDPSLKSCFIYCALFPKDYKIKKEKIISFWLAQGYIVPLHGGQNLDDAAEEHFTILLRRCFFQDVVIDEYGDVMCVTTHDLMHDVAKKMGDEKLCIIKSKAHMMDDKIRHVYIHRESQELFMGNKKMRSYIYHFGHFVDEQINNFTHLRILVLSSCNLKSLPDSIGELLHLRHLDLSTNPCLEVLCESITELYNLQTLILMLCVKLRELPRGTSKLVNLRHLNLHDCPDGIRKLVNLKHLNLSYCRMLRELPKGISNLVNLGHLNLSSCGELRELPEGISKLVNLKHLNLNCCRMLRELPKGISNLVNLGHLSLKLCRELRELPEGISKLVNLKNLNLNSCRMLRELLEGISKLVNLKNLNLNSCRMLRELPKGISKLVKLKHLNILDCNGLTSMPLGIDKLTNLEVLPLFLVGHNGITNQEQNCETGRLKDLKALKKIQDKMIIRIGLHYRHVEDENNDMGNYLKSMEYLRELKIYFNFGYEENADDEGILEKLEPPSNLQKLYLERYKGKRIRWWERVGDYQTISLSLLVNIKIEWCNKLEHLPMLSKLPHLKLLHLVALQSLEYIENGMSNDKEASTAQFFPSLEYIFIYWLLNLKGWWKVEGFNFYFPRLSTLEILGCPNLASNIICPTLKTLKLSDNNEMLQITYGTLQDEAIKLRTLAVSPVAHVKIICRSYNDEEEENKGESLIEEIEKASQYSSSFLQELIIYGSFFINYGYDYEDSDEDEYEDEDEDEDDEEETWKSFHDSLHGLQTLSLQCCGDMNEVPEWISCLSSLQFLFIWSCRNIKTLPESFKHLTSLEKLEINDCPNLKERCRKTDGEDFPKIQHIPQVLIDGKFIK